MLHRARAERIDASVNRIVVAGQSDVVTHGLGLGQAGKIEGGIALARSQSRPEVGWLVDIDA